MGQKIGVKTILTFHEASKLWTSLQCMHRAWCRPGTIASTSIFISLLDLMASHSGIIALKDSNVVAFSINDIFKTPPEPNTSIDYFKCVQHTGQRPETHHTPPSRPQGLCDYAYPVKWDMRDCASICAYNVHQALCRQQACTACHPRTGSLL